MCRSMKRQATLVCLLALLAGTMLFASASAEKVHLKFSMWISDATEAAEQVELLNKYMKENPNVEIELFHQGWGGYHEKLLTMAAGGIAPDVMVLSRLQMPTFADAGVIQPIDQWYNKESAAVRRDVMETVSGTYNNKFWGIPIWGGPTVLEYNADLFDKIGAIQPYSLAQKNQWTWDRFIEYGRKITSDTNGDGIKDVFMHAKLGTRAADWYIKVRSYNADVLTADGKAFTDVNALEKGLEFYSDIAWRHHIAPTGSETSNFTKGTEAMYFTWLSDAPNHYQGVKGQFRVELTTPPTGPAGPFTIVGGCPIAISSTTPHAYEAYKFAKWYALESEHWKVRGVPASMNDLRREYREYLGTMYSWPDAVVAAMSGNMSMEPGVGKYFNEFNKAWNNSLGAIAKGTMAPREGAIRIIEDTKRILAEGK